jgi:TetR/AcrR family transcriptional repressor of nem operon
MRKGEKTRQHIISKSAELFNQKGYAGSSIQDIIQVTGLTKGGIYRQFSGKDEIAAEAFDFAGRILSKQFVQAAQEADTATEKVMAICNVHSDPVHNPPLKGGCPLLNMAVECDEGYPELREKALKALNDFLLLIQNILNQGVDSGEFRSDMNTKAVSSYIVSSLEGGVMASRLSRDNEHVGFVIEQLKIMLLTYAKA